MGEYDAVWVLLISLVFMSFYILKTKPKGSKILTNLSNTINRFFRNK